MLRKLFLGVVWLTFTFLPREIDLFRLQDALYQLSLKDATWGDIMFDITDSSVRYDPIYECDDCFASREYYEGMVYSALPFYVDSTSLWAVSGNMGFMKVKVLRPYFDDQFEEDGDWFRSGTIGVIIDEPRRWDRRPKIVTFPDAELFKHFAKHIRAKPDQIELHRRIEIALLLSAGYMRDDKVSNIPGYELPLPYGSWEDRDGTLIVRHYYHKSVPETEPENRAEPRLISLPMYDDQEIASESESGNDKAGHSQTLPPTLFECTLTVDATQEFTYTCVNSWPKTWIGTERQVWSQLMREYRKEQIAALERVDPTLPYATWG